MKWTDDMSVNEEVFWYSSIIILTTLEQKMYYLRTDILCKQPSHTTLKININ